jgi:hypothetical protein
MIPATMRRPTKTKSTSNGTVAKKEPDMARPRSMSKLFCSALMTIAQIAEHAGVSLAVRALYLAVHDRSPALQAPR